MSFGVSPVNYSDNMYIMNPSNNNFIYKYSSKKPMLNMYGLAMVVCFYSDCIL